MNEKQHEMLEHISLKTIDHMFKEKNINVISWIKQTKEKNLFFPEFYEMMYSKMLMEFTYDVLLKITISYEDFGLQPFKANEIFNDTIKHMDIQRNFTTSTTVDALKLLHEKNIFLSSENMKKIQDNIYYTKREEIIANNEKIKSYITLNNKLPEKGIVSNTRKI